MEELKFNSETHTYTLGDKVLPSVTTILGSTLFPTKYDGINEEVLEKAAHKGAYIHKEIEDYVNKHISGLTEEFEAFKNLFLAGKLGDNILNSELMVHNEEYAGTIDLVFEKNNKLCLGDIKTTAELDKDYVSWQLSFYKYAYEYLNKDKEIREGYAIWLRGDKAKIYKVELKSREQVNEILCAFHNGQIKELSPSNLQTIPLEQQNAFMGLIHSLKAIEEQTKEVKERILKEMEDRGLNKAEIGDVVITYKAPTTRVSVDSNKLKEDGLYDKYTKTSNIKSSITIKIKD